MTVTGNVDVQPQAELNVGFDSALPQPSSTIDGNVYVGKGATLVASSDISLDLTLGGNIEANQCNTVLLGPVIVGGNVDIQNCSGAESGYETAQIGGNFTCDDNSRCLAAFGQVRGNMQINDNAEADVGNNTVGGNLRCQTQRGRLWQRQHGRRP